ncbi:serine/threonine-protein kinase PLK4 [Plodia interpunctella]|uniref:serine/threonine-protein kinase PLK4 n=1 Tax=Plodia interpunctella TaxID=58824 RepID=UPI002367B340|nr:serine/threonine-protein kinase PLK4 [Plodia interpunctella]XP_053625456.1 serine/threonine-protein kinase PLK4 [Plodia interpunctella]XP_053625457.1 serine/threonine-protein kinase PLK4 [Plodia interpunctella]XP_053625458.1 serine/threonine-protein kinase PLK4 [Plodia interpunctella]XP_053625459.1 serine/threonine-protein kinase PLK4 [Plodia interpunctella]
MFGEKIEDYEILEHLGKGGFAHVYRARCRKTGLFVAIKMIDKALMARANMIGRVRQEVTIHSRLKHPAILELYTFFEDAHYVYLVLELAHNGELAKHFKLGTRGLSEKAAADIFRQVVSGVLYLHSYNIIHRDLSLNNLLLTKDLNVKIADFGLATQLNGPDEKHVTMCGTPNYISPEVASREFHGLPADVWGLGCMLYTLLVGSPPFHTQHVKTTLNKVINADYKIPNELSLQAQNLLQKLLCKDPTQRITLKEIMEHPFLNSLCYAKQDFSRDSGFLTTLHSTQHSSKQRHDDQLGSDYLGICKEQNVNNFIERKEVRPSSFNIFTGILEYSSQITGQDCRMNLNCEKGFAEVFDSRNQSSSNLLQKPDSICSNNPIIDRIKKLEIKCGSNQSLDIADDNKENIQKLGNLNTNSLGVPPLCAERLPTISHRTRNAILKIEPSGVIVEFIKKKGKDREEKVVEICKISKDGMKIIIYTVDNKDRVNLANVDHDPSPDEVFSYHNLPQKHWKKYLYASRFVDLVKAKTPKITLYSPLAKCQLMENGTDIDMFFYNGEKVTFTSADGLKIIDKALKTYHNASTIPELKHLIDHYDECSNRIKRVQSALSCIPDECFPLIIGKRPVSCMANMSSPYNGSVAPNYNTPVLNVGSFHRTNASTSQTPSEYNIL